MKSVFYIAGLVVINSFSWLLIIKGLSSSVITTGICAGSCCLSEFIIHRSVLPGSDGSVEDFSNSDSFTFI